MAASRSSGVVEGSKSGVNVGSEGKAGGTVFLDLRLGNWRGGSWGKKGNGMVVVVNIRGSDDGGYSRGIRGSDSRGW